MRTIKSILHSGKALENCLKRVLVYPKYQVLVLLVFVMIGNYGCVGTVQDSSQAFTEVVTKKDTPLVFPGVASVSAISDTRLEVFFYPATGGSGKYTYDVTIGNSSTPLSYPSDVLHPDYRGMLKVTISGLARLTTYLVKVEVRNGTSTVQSNSQVAKSATTFDNEVADFGGITSAYNMAGPDGKDSIKIRWAPAKTSGGIVKQNWDPKSYEVVVVDSEKLTPGDMDGAFTNAQGKWLYEFNHDDTVNEYVVRGLNSKKRYYIRMRAIHEASIVDIYNPRLKGEQNTNYVTISTLSDSLADLNFDPQSFTLALAAGEQGLTAIQATWKQAAGVFDHYRLYYSLEGSGVSSGSLPDLCLTPDSSPVGSTVFCKKVDLNIISTPITGLSPYTTYDVVLILCQTPACLTTERIASPVRTIKTDPSFATFSGLKSVTTASVLEDVGSVYLNYDVPNFTSGYFDGLVVKMRRTLDGSDAEVLVTESSTTVYHESYSYVTASQIHVLGIDYSSAIPYCFTVYPFKYDTDGVTKRELPNNVWKCVQPQISAPTALQFPGLVAVSTSKNTVSLTWTTPVSGIYSQFEIFYRKQSNIFSWGDAIAQAANGNNFTNYGRKVVDGSVTQITLDGVADGNYAFGVTSYMNYVTDTGSVVLRSETNGGIFKCAVSGANNDTLACTQ